MRMRLLASVLLLSAACGFGDNTARSEIGVDANTNNDAAIPVVDAPLPPDSPPPTPDAPPAPACGLVPQSGCSGSTPACDLSATGDTECRAVTAQGTSNSHCATDTACRAGYTCLGDGSSNLPWCARFCEVDSDCNGAGSRCVVGITTGNTALDVDVCSNACDPYGQTGCPSDMGCVARNDAAGDYTDCRYMGSLPDGAACTKASDCMTGSDCVGTAGATVCRAYCVVGNSTTCPVGDSCVGFVAPLTISGVEYGACL